MQHLRRIHRPGQEVQHEKRESRWRGLPGAHDIPVLFEGKRIISMKLTCLRGLPPSPVFTFDASGKVQRCEACNDNNSKGVKRSWEAMLYTDLLYTI